MTATSPGTDHMVGDYRLLTKIGEGGMGVVHLAQAPDGHRVALKVLRPHIIGDDEARERLAREVASLRRVTSPRIAEVIDADPWGDVPYVATRYVPGLSLHQHIREHGPITGPDLRWFAAGLAEAMIAVHLVGVLHRDIKPSNVLLEGRSPVLIDFGLARLAEDPRLTHTGWLLGTPGYLAPEILYGEDATTASDVHAWAATLVFAATGRPPFGTGPAMAIMDRVRRGEHDLTGVPADLLPLVREGLAPDPDDRPTTGAVLAAVRPQPAGAPAETPQDDFTLPWMLAQSAPDDADPTDVLGDEPTTGTVAAPPPTRPLTVPSPVMLPHEPARQPYVQPPAPRQSVGERPRLVPPGTMRTSGTAKLQRGLCLGGAFGSVAAGVAVAPYLTFVLLAALALTVRTISWTTESARERQHLRGRRRWYDGPLTLATSPWYLVVAAGGTVMLLAWAGLVTSMVGLVVALFRPSASFGLLVIGGVLALTLWWGPGAKRLRLPTQRILAGATRDPWIGWTVVAGVGIVFVALLFAFAAGDVSWAPQPGPPWRDGTMLGRLLLWTS
ncbi:MAG: protein kinase domain-containing protein [Nocardioides sp.]